MGYEVHFKGMSDEVMDKYNKKNKGIYGFSTNNVAPIIPNNDIEELDMQSSDDDQSIISNNLTRDTINSTLRVDSKEKLENTIELKIKNNNKKYYDIPQLSPYSIVDDDVI